MLNGDAVPVGDIDGLHGLVICLARRVAELEAKIERAIMANRPRHLFFAALLLATSISWGLGFQAEKAREDAAIAALREAEALCNNPDRSLPPANQRELIRRKIFIARAWLGDLDQ